MPLTTRGPVWSLRAPGRAGVHLVTRDLVEALPEMASVRVGLAHLFIRHTSASLALNENASPDVRTDLEAWLSRAVPDGSPEFRHTLEGPDDMPAHVKAVIVGESLTLPVEGGRLALGTVAGRVPLRAPRPRRRPLDHDHRVGRRLRTARPG